MRELQDGADEGGEEVSVVARPLEEWHGDVGDVLWWRFPIQEPPWVGSPLDDDWVDGYYTHWTPLDPPDLETPDLGVPGRVEYRQEPYRHAVTQDYSRFIAALASVTMGPEEAHWRQLCWDINRVDDPPL